MIEFAKLRLNTYSNLKNDSCGNKKAKAAKKVSRNENIYLKTTNLV